MEPGFPGAHGEVNQQMLESAVVAINEWLQGATLAAGLGAFLWGMVSVLLSPCHMASIPLMVAYVAGQSRALRPKEAFHYAVSFTTGLFLTIALVGIVCAILGRMLAQLPHFGVVFGGILVFWWW